MNDCRRESSVHVLGRQVLFQEFKFRRIAEELKKTDKTPKRKCVQAVSSFEHLKPKIRKNKDRRTYFFAREERR